MRRARPAEAAVLSALACRSKGHWGYDPGFMEECRDELSISAAFIREREVYVLETAGRIEGYYSLVRRDSDAGLDHFFVDPLALGKGAGRRLWNHAVERARSLGFKRLVIESDPHAESFYRRLGAERVGESASGSIPGRMLPLLRFELGDGTE